MVILTETVCWLITSLSNPGQLKLLPKSELNNGFPQNISLVIQNICIFYHNKLKNKHVLMDAS